MLIQGGGDVNVFAFERDYFVGREPNCSVSRLGSIARGRYVSRLAPLLSALPRIRAALTHIDYIYAFGPDMALIAHIASIGKRIPVIMEIGDIRRAQTIGGFKGHFIRFVDRWIANRCRLLVLTSDKFLSEYYKKRLGVLTKGIIIENKLERSLEKFNFSNQTKQPLKDRPLRIGYFGLLRCQWSWNVLENVAKSSQRHIEILVAGHPIDPMDLPDRVQEISNIKYLGTYKSPDDLPKLYGQVDLVWGCYPCPKKGDMNWRWARTNRFYESCFFQRPIIALEGSGDAVEVLKHDIGLSVKGPGVHDAVNALLSIDFHQISRWNINMKNLPQSVYQYSTECDTLIEEITSLNSNRSEP